VIIQRFSALTGCSGFGKFVVEARRVGHLLICLSSSGIDVPSPWCLVV
jgi:hypothetical protein